MLCLERQLEARPRLALVSAEVEGLHAADVGGAGSAGAEAGRAGRAGSL